MNETMDKQIIPWQQRKEIGFIKALWDTIKQILFEPDKFFENLEIKDSYKEPYYFYFILTATTSIVSQLTGLLLAKIIGSILPIGKILSLRFLLINFVFSLISSLIIAAIGGFVLSAIVHLFVRLLKGEKPFIATFNVIAYSSAASIFIIIPVLGELISAVWAFIIVMKGLKEVHMLSVKKSVGALLCSFILLFSVAIAFKWSDILKANDDLAEAKIEAYEAEAKANCKAISVACQLYYDEHGFYPASLTDLTDNKYTLYFNFNLTKAVSPSSAIQGYYYVYERLDDEHFNLYAKPAIEGRQIFFIDQTGYLRLSGPDGSRVR